MTINSLITKEDYQGVLILVDENDMIKLVNDKFASLLGYSSADLIDTQFIDLIVPSDKSLYYDITYKVDNYKELTLKMYHKRGTYRYFKLVLHDFGTEKLLLGKDIKRNYVGNIYQSNTIDDVLEDLFKTIQSEDILDLIDINSTSLSLLFDLLPLDIWIKDQFGRYIYCNDSFSKHTGNYLEDIYLKDDFSVYNDEIANAFVNSDKEAIESKNRIVYSFQSKVSTFLAWTEVTKIPVFNNEDNYLGIIGYSIDITDNKKAELKLLDETRKHQLILNLIDGLIFELNSNKKLVFVNGKLNHQYQLIEDLNNHPLQKIILEDDIFSEKIKLALSNNTSEFTLDYDGKILNITLIAYQTDNKQSVLGYGKVMNDD